MTPTPPDRPSQLKLTKARFYQVTLDNGHVTPYVDIEVQLLDAQGELLLRFGSQGTSLDRALWKVALRVAQPTPEPAKMTVIHQVFHGLTWSPN